MTILLISILAVVFKNLSHLRLTKSKSSHSSKSVVSDLCTK